MNWRYKNGKYIINNNGVYMALIKADVFNMRDITDSIICGLDTYKQKDARVKVLSINGDK